MCTTAAAVSLAVLQIAMIFRNITAGSIIPTDAWYMYLFVLAGRSASGRRLVMRSRTVLMPTTSAAAHKQH